MKKSMIFTAGLLLGAAAGCLMTKGYFKDKYARQAQEEIDSVIEVFKGKKNQEKTEENVEEETPTVSEPEKAAYFDMVGKMYQAPESVDVNDVYKPYVIAPEEFGVKEGYDTVSLTYYSDNILADDTDRVMTDSDIAATVGMDCLSCFGMYEEDSVHVRNDRIKCDYEILIDPRTYEEILENKPYLRKQ